MTGVIALRPCGYCGKLMQPRTWSNGDTEAPSQYARRKHCDAICHHAHRQHVVRTRKEKRCPRCGETKPVEAFRPHRSHPDGRDGFCRPCENDYERWWKGNTEKGRALVRRVARRRSYGIEPADYDRLLAAQGGVCAVCGLGESVRDRRGEVKPLSVDHDHSTGQVRGLLCQRCNQGIGNFKESPKRLRNAAAYVERYR